MRLIKLNRNLFAKVDIQDYGELSKHKWYARKRSDGKAFYAARAIYHKNKQTILKMPEAIIGKKEGFIIDHINGDTLDNRRCNLRQATHQQNMCNGKITKTKKSTSKYRGVYRKKGKKIRPWVASIANKNTQIHIGYFQTEKEAALAYDKKVRILHGEFSITNFN